MNKKYALYKLLRVEVETTNSMEDTTQGKGGEYNDCEDGILYFATQEPSKAFSRWNVIKVEVLGDIYVDTE